MPRKTLMSKSLFVYALLMLSIIFVSRTYAQRQPPFDALEGLDPVMLVQGKEVQGELNITVTRGQFRYMFANAANKATFEQDPTRYEIQLGGACARMGAPVRGTPDLYTVYQGRIYIFGSGECKKKFEAAPENYLEPENRAKTKAAYTPEALKKGQALVEQAVAAMGGAARLDSLTSYQEKNTTLQQTQQGDVEVKTDLTAVFPDRLHLERAMPDWNNSSALRRMTIVITPREVFGSMAGVARSLPDTARLEPEREFKQRPFSILRARKSAGFNPAALGGGKIGETT